MLSPNTICKSTTMDLIKSKELGLSDIEDKLDSQGIRILVRNNYVPKNYFNCHDVDDFEEIIPIVNVELYRNIFKEYPRF